MSQRHLFIIDPVRNLNFDLDTSLRTAFHLSTLGHEAFGCEASQLSWNSREESASAQVFPLTFGATPQDLKIGAEALVPLHSFQGIHMRKEPPFDIAYVATTWLLDSVTKQVHVFNHPSALREFNEKLAILRFPDCHRPALVSSDAQQLFAFLKDQADGDAIVKPLTLFGGRGIYRLQLGANLTAEKCLSRLKEDTKGTDLRMIQAFDPRVFDGEVRLFATGAEHFAWCLKKPQGDQFLANTSAGAELHSHTPSDEEMGRAKRISQELLKDGIYLVGYDLIGGYVSEINVTSPRLLTAPDDPVNHYEPMARWLSDRCDSAPPS